MIRKYTINTSRREVNVSEPMDNTQVDRRLELAGQGLALQLAAEHGYPERVSISARVSGSPGAKPGALDTWNLSVATADGSILGASDVTLSHVFLYETQALVDALAPLGLFRAGEKALSLFRQDEQDPMPECLEFTYRLPDTEPGAQELESALLSTRATRRIARLMREDASLDLERKGFVVGTLDSGYTPRIEDVLVPEEDQGQEPSASREHVDIEPADWLWAQAEVERLGPPLQILGVFHTQPGGLKPSMTDIHLFQWSGSASSVFLVACMAEDQPVVAAYRFDLGRLVQVDLKTERTENPQPAACGASSEEED